MKQCQTMKNLVSALSNPTYISKPILSHLLRATAHSDLIHDNTLLSGRMVP